MAPVPSGTAGAPAVRVLGELRGEGCAPRALRSGLHANLQQRLRDRANLFPCVRSYSETVVQKVENALLCGREIILLAEIGKGASGPFVHRAARYRGSQVAQRSLTWNR